MSAAVAGGLCTGLVLLLACAGHTIGAALSRFQARRRFGNEQRAASPLSLPVPPAWFARRWRRGAVPLDPALGWAGWLTAIACLLVGALAMSGPVLAVVVGVAAVAGPVLVLWAADSRSDRRVEAALPEALEGVARSLRSGASLHLALAEAAVATPVALGDDLRTVVDAASRGATLVSALEAWEGRRPLPGIRLAVAVLALGAETGGAHARAVDGVAETVRSRLAVGAEVRALSSQARYSGLVIALAPIGFAAVAAATDERTADFLFREPLGLACLTTGLALDGLAGLWMHRLSQVEP